LSKEGADPVEQVKEICAIMLDGEVSVEVTEKEPDAVYKQAKEIAKLAKNVVVKVPCHTDYYVTIRKLIADGIPLNITLVFSLIQSLMMCKLGVRYISPFVGRLNDIGEDGALLLQEIRTMIDGYGYETQMLAASIRGVQDLHNAIMAGADVATVPVNVLEKATQHVLTDKGMAQFDADWQKLGIKQFP
jgi:transaldolase